MSFDYSNGCYFDGDFTVAKACGPVRSENPFDFQPNTLVYRQRHCQLARYFRALPNLTPMPGFRDVVPTLTGSWKVNFRQGTAVVVGAPTVRASPAEVKTALESLSSIGPGKIQAVTGNFDSGYNVEFIQHSGLMPKNHLIKCNMHGVNPPYKMSVAVTQQSPTVIQHLLPQDASTTDGGSYLVQETSREPVGGGVVEWDRVYANVPKDYIEYQAYNYQMQRMTQIRIPWSGQTDIFGNFQGTYRTFTNLAEWAEPLTAKVAYKFCRGSKLGTAKAPFYIPYRIIHYRDSFGQEYVYQVGVWGVAEPTSARRWLGDIWEVRNVIVQPY